MPFKIDVGLNIRIFCINTVFSYEPRGSRSSLGYGRRPVPVTEPEIERERENLQDEFYNLEYEMKVGLHFLLYKESISCWNDVGRK